MPRRVRSDCAPVIPLLLEVMLLPLELPLLFSELSDYLLAGVGLGNYSLRVEAWKRKCFCLISLYIKL